MNIQIFGTKKSFDTKKAQRYFKERRIKVQFIDLREKEMSKGELQSVMRAVGGIDALLDPKAKDQDTLALVQHLAESQRFDKLLKTSRCSRSPSCATDVPPPSATPPTFGRPGSRHTVHAQTLVIAAAGKPNPQVARGCFFGMCKPLCDFYPTGGYIRRGLF